MFNSFLRGLFILLLPLCAEATGNVSYQGRVAPLLAARPDLAVRLEGLSIAESGVGFRIGALVCPALAGERVGPYEFEAIDESHGQRAVLVRFRTLDRFFDSAGTVVAEYVDGEQVGDGDIATATVVKEELVDISVQRTP